MSEYHSMKRQALIKTFLASAVGFYAVVCTVTTTLSLMAQ